MNLIYDEAKRQTNLAKHGFDFADLDPEFFISSKVVRARGDRFMAIGLFRDVVVAAVVFRPLGSEALFDHLDAPRQREGKEHPVTRKKKLSEAEIKRMIASDPDAPEATDEQLAQAKPFAEVFPALVESIRRSRGRPAIDRPRKQISIRLDPDVIDKFKATGPGWQSRINDALKAAKVD